MGGLEAKDVYLGILRLQYRYNTKVSQIFSDRGSQIAAKILGRRRNYYQKSLRRLWGVHNNLGYSQFRNIAERKISTLKQLIRQGIFGIPGPQQETVDRSILETAIQGAISMVNNVPYTSVGLNQSFMCPSDILTPWKVSSASNPPDVQELPETKLQTLLDARKAMCVKQGKIREIMMEELRTDVLRFKAGKLKLGSNKSSPQIRPGGDCTLGAGRKATSAGSSP